MHLRQAFLSHTPFEVPQTAIMFTVDVVTTVAPFSGPSVVLELFDDHTCQALNIEAVQCALKLPQPRLSMPNSSPCTCLHLQTEDRVYSRWLAISLFIVAVLFVMRAGLYVIYLYSPLAPTKATIPLLRQMSDLSGSGIIGVVQSKPYIVAKLTDSAGNGVRGQNVTASLSIINVQQEALQLRYGFEGTMLDFHGLPQGATAEGGGTYALPGFVPRAFLTPRVGSTAGVTDSSGQVSFSKLAVSSSLTAKHQVTLQVSAPASTFGGSGGGASDASSSGSGRVVRTFPGGTIDFATPVASVRFLASPLTLQAPPLALGAQLPPLRLQVLDSSRRPLRGKVVVLQSAPPSAGEFASLSARPDTLIPRFALLNGAAVSALTDTTGIVTLSNVSVLASSTATVMLEGACTMHGCSTAACVC